MMVFIVQNDAGTRLAASIDAATAAAKELAATVDGEWLGGHWEGPFNQRIETEDIGRLDVAFWRSAAGTLVSAYQATVYGA